MAQKPLEFAHGVLLGYLMRETTMNFQIMRKEQFVTLLKNTIVRKLVGKNIPDLEDEEKIVRALGFAAEVMEVMFQKNLL